MAHRYCISVKPLLTASMVLLSVAWHTQTQAFRNCDPSLDSDVFRGNSGYLIGELEFDEYSGLARGTETHYNFSNSGADGVNECHVTYEISGIYDASSTLFLLDANLTGHSHGCDSDFIDASYPTAISYTLQAAFGRNGMVEVVRAESGETLGSGSSGEGVLSYKTAETCELY